MPAFNSFQNKEIRLVYCILTRQTQEEMKIVWYSNQIQSSFHNPKTQKKFLTIWKPSISILYFNILACKKNIFHPVWLFYIFLLFDTIYHFPSSLFASHIGGNTFTPAASLTHFLILSLHKINPFLAKQPTSFASRRR